MMRCASHNYCATSILYSSTVIHIISTFINLEVTFILMLRFAIYCDTYYFHVYQSGSDVPTYAAVCDLL